MYEIDTNLALSICAGVSFDAVKRGLGVYTVPLNGFCSGVVRAASTALAEGEALDVGLGVGIGVGSGVGAGSGVGVGVGLGLRSGVALGVGVGVGVATGVALGLGGGVIVGVGESPFPFVVLGMHIRPCLTVPVGHCLVSGCMFTVNLENTSCS